MPPLVNFAAFQTVWFLSLQGAGSGRPWLGTLAFLGFLALQLRLGRSAAVDIRMALLAAVTGFLCDTLYVQAGLIRYASPQPWTATAPFWIVVMWANFGLTLNSSLRWLQGRPLLAAALGAGGGPLAYLAGVKLNAATLGARPAMVYGVLAVVWALAVPGLMAVVQRLARMPARHQRSAAPTPGATAPGSGSGTKKERAV